MLVSFSFKYLIELFFLIEEISGLLSTLFASVKRKVTTTEIKLIFL